MSHDWLPELYDTDPFDLEDDAERESCLDALYAIFRADFVESRPTLNALPVTHYSGPGCGDGRGEAFWHLTTKETLGRGSLRERDWDRCRRIRWPRPVIEAIVSRSDIKFWRTSGVRQKARLHLALSDFSYVVILEDRPSEAILVSAFPATYSNYRRDLEREWGRGRI
jgi:hypothetical protein